jgi:hypothetical protein
MIMNIDDIKADILRQEILDFVESPNSFLEILASFVDYLTHIQSDGNLDDKIVQLNEIDKAIKSLENQRVIVPDRLRAEKSRLFSEIDSLSSLPLLRNIKVLLSQITSSIDSIENSNISKKGRLSQLPRTDNKTLRQVLIVVLREKGGRASLEEVKEEIELRLYDRFLPGDLVMRDDGRTYTWFNNILWEKHKMVNEGILKDNSPIGYVELNGD